MAARRSDGKTPAPSELTTEQKRQVAAWRDRHFPWITNAELGEQWDDYRCWTEAGGYRYTNHTAAFKSHIRRKVERGLIRKPAEALGSAPGPAEAEWQRRQREERRERERQAWQELSRLGPLELEALRQQLREAFLGKT